MKIDLTQHYSCTHDLQTTLLHLANISNLSYLLITFTHCNIDSINNFLFIFTCFKGPPLEEES